LSNVARGDPVFSAFPELNVLRRIPSGRMKMPEVIVLLDVSPETACRRISSRGEKQQAHETADKLTRLREAYHFVCEIMRDHYNLPVQVITGEPSPDEATRSALEFINAQRDVEDEE
jgi:thymidylate kinase